MKHIFQQLRLPHRILLILVLGVLMPMTFVLSLSLSRLENELKEQSFQRLRFETKTISMSIMGRVRQLESEMRYFARINVGTEKNMNRPLSLKDSRYQECHFEALVYVGPNGSVNLFGDSPAYSSIQPSALKRTPSEKPLLIEQYVLGRPLKYSWPSLCPGLHGSLV